MSSDSEEEETIVIDGITMYCTKQAPQLDPSTKIDTVTVQCVCDKTKEHAGMAPFRIYCRTCDTWQHSLCYGLLPNDLDAFQLHVCLACALKHPILRCTDDTFQFMGDWDLNRRSVYRRMLWWCCDLDYLDVQTLVNFLSVPVQQAFYFMLYFQVLRVIKPLGPGQENRLTTKRAIDVPGLYEMLPAFYKNCFKLMPSIISEINKRDERKRNRRISSSSDDIQTDMETDVERITESDRGTHTETDYEQSTDDDMETDLEPYTETDSKRGTETDLDTETDTN